MRASWNIGRVAGIDLFLHPTFLLLLAIVGLTNADGLGAVVLVASVFGCVLLHELGHALMARRFGIATADITLYPIGGVARLDRMPREPGAELRIALAGPAVNVALAVAGWALLTLRLSVDPWASRTSAFGFVSTLVTINVGLALFNMIPAFPMDGGRVVRALLSGWLGRLRATEIASTIGRALALAFGIYSFLQGDLLRVALAGFIYLAASAEMAHVSDEEETPRPPRGGNEDRDARDTPSGFAWVRRGQGVWQLCPIPIRASNRTSSWL